MLAKPPVSDQLTSLGNGTAKLRFVLLLVTLPLHYTKNNFASQSAAKGVIFMRKI